MLQALSWARGGGIHVLQTSLVCCLFIMGVNELLEHLLTAQQPEQKHEIYINNL